ncbi:SusD/RagB family nutrient-binding outer membrane lipoprotein [Dinghuibacter silviterrae]|uniref:SusD-like starch-binding protein associating with outer membrane n=1 Tax=Dinghuibacter silviterrae TaxID=1539049 RepID=A0A4R8DF42_9BACT|nr:SusD/RagB family nutrient-binding outer membrane lipoprotein [Dinghuibacter silviterrae]TDW95908.1 SusD-like starch-binding protein associating with outer membrane [Dinghuibacter silviterrae]
MTKMYQRTYILGALLFCFGCSRSNFAGLNTNPDAVLSIDPKTELTPAEVDIHVNDFEVFYDFVRDIKPWTQTYVLPTGNTSTFLTGASTSNINYRWGNFYGGVGDNLTDVLHIIDNMSPDLRAQYQQFRAIVSIPRIYYAFYTSDANGSIPYNQAFLARYTKPAYFTPVYDPQQQLFDTLDAQLARAVAVLEANPAVTQISPAANDLYYGGDIAHWIKAANSLRLKIAMRLMKQDPARLTAIANAVLADPVGLIAANTDDWILYSTTVGTGGNSNPGLQSGARNTVNFMWATTDPRLRIFYQPAGITSADMLDSAEAQGVIPNSVTWDGQLYRGQYASPTASQDPSKGYMFHQLTFSYKGIPTQVYWPSIINQGLTYCVYNGSGGTNMFPVITYADVCFMRAELSVRGLDNDNVRADSLYYRGIRASLMDYDHWGAITLLPGYTPLQYAEITNYLAQPGVVYNASTALEQICDQQYLNFFVQPNECWALIKRTGFPAVGGQVMPFEDVSASGKMPRRYPALQPSLGDLNYTNETNAIDSMALDPNYGAPSDMTGRVWWDKP